ncbi:YjbH domain-containing protein [Bacteroidales bacterium OttesenSCG-928-L03]|nr:YjbH domain-containing protein [Bacteroidales bacterium OttesenSCG-928-L03]
MKKSPAFVIWGILCGLFLHSIPLNAQYSQGTTGLLNTPTAEMQPDGTFMAGANFLPETMLPEYWDYNSGNYFLNITFLSFFEVAYRCTFIRHDYGNGNQWQQDRSVSLRLRALKESRYLPALLLGSNDAFTTSQVNMFKDSGGNRFFSSVYGVATKHFDWGGEWGMTLGYMIPFHSKVEREGLFGGLSYSPSFLPEGKGMLEYDTESVNIGVSYRLFRHLSIHAFAYNFEAFSGGIRYEFTLIK